MKYLFACFNAVLISSLFSTSAIAQQPFSNIQSSPTVSPYLNLVGRNGQGTGFGAYQNLVQPFIQQQQINNQQQQQIQSLQHQQQASLTGPERRGISNEIRGTGHVTAYMDYLHYYSRQTSANPQAPRQ